MTDFPTAWTRFDSDNIRLDGVDCLSDNWYHLYRVRFALKRRDGEWQDQNREAYDRGNGAGILLFNRANRTIILTRQFRMPTFVNGNETGMLIEVPAGLLDDRAPNAAVIAEVEEETGYKIGKPRQVFDVFMSPGSVTERLHLFVAEISTDHLQGEGGGKYDEGEDISVLETPFADVIAMIADGRIRDAKTIMLVQYAQLNGLFD
ncbi:NUDIX domain-containing protein [uncultured Thalassospira sp.]|jgi:nudix-type nucleoside diphosphatase (YffH/AdpP family)|uniref:NUDIX domain-containing protein n=1 Tax=uncultured Thalassospira sp. TaxID=404382 RepID=UPI0030DA82D1|tara:strand:- start:5888 stop:6502 length:615 start_codon:yes stop_codon:yes gene_type:complete